MTQQAYYDLRTKAPKYISITKIEDDVVILSYSFKDIIFTKSAKEANRFINKIALRHEGWL